MGETEERQALARRLSDLMCLQCRDSEHLRSVIGGLPGGSKILDELPGANAPLSEVSEKAAALFERHGLLTAEVHSAFGVEEAWRQGLRYLSQTSGVAEFDVADFTARLLNASVDRLEARAVGRGVTVEAKQLADQIGEAILSAAKALRLEDPWETMTDVQAVCSEVNDRAHGSDGSLFLLFEEWTSIRGGIVEELVGYVREAREVPLEERIRMADELAKVAGRFRALDGPRAV